MRFTHRFSILFLIVPLIAFAATAQERVARLVTTARAVEWHPAIYGAGVLAVQRPDGEVVTEPFSAGRNPMLRLDGLADGLYSYELRVTQEDGTPLVQAGTFTIANGAVVSPNGVERRPMDPVTNPFYSDDVSAQGGLCGGLDCTNAESYGLSPIKMKANNTRIKFEDTSTAVGFPSTDWQLSANDSASGGANKFFVEDLTAATSPFIIEGATPTNTLYVDSNGRIGIRTSTPARELTISVPVSAGIRMEQSASPFQAWDIVANNNNFYVRDVNHESDPFIIKTAAPYYSLVVDSTGRIGLGVNSPLYQIHHSSGARLDAGNWINASSREIKQDIHALDAGAAFDTLKKLEPVTFAYKANPAETNVGFIAEDVPDLVATSDRKGLSSMDVVAVLTKVIQEQQRTIENLEMRLQKLEKQ